MSVCLPGVWRPTEIPWVFAGRLVLLHRDAAVAARVPSAVRRARCQRVRWGCGVLVVPGGSSPGNHTLLLDMPVAHLGCSA
jgi:hypothetical protein